MFASITLQSMPRCKGLKGIYEKHFKGYNIEYISAGKTAYYRVTVNDTPNNNVKEIRIIKALNKLKNSGCRKIIVPRNFEFCDLIENEGFFIVRADRVLKEHIGQSLKNIINQCNLDVRRNSLCIRANSREAVKCLAQIYQYSSQLYIWSYKLKDDDAEYLMEQAGVSVIYTNNKEAISRCKFLILYSLPEDTDILFKNTIIYNLSGERFKAGGNAIVVDDLVFKLPDFLVSSFPGDEFSTSEFLEAVEYDCGKINGAKIKGYLLSGIFIPLSDTVFTSILNKNY